MKKIIGVLLILLLLPATGATLAVEQDMPDTTPAITATEILAAKELLCRPHVTTPFHTHYYLIKGKPVIAVVLPNAWMVYRYCYMEGGKVLSFVLVDDSVTYLPEQLEPEVEQWLRQEFEKIPEMTPENT